MTTYPAFEEELVDVFFLLLLRARTFLGSGRLPSDSSATSTSGGEGSVEEGGTLVVGVEGASAMLGTGGNGLAKEVSACCDDASESTSEEQTGGSIGIDWYPDVSSGADMEGGGLGGEGLAPKHGRWPQQSVHEANRSLAECINC